MFPPLLSTLRFFGLLLLNIFAVVIGTAVLEATVGRTIPARTVVAVFWKETALSITCATLVGFGMWQTWRSEATKWTWNAPSHDPNLDEYISKAVSLRRSCSNLSADECVKRLAADGIDRRTAASILVFLSTAYFRVLYRNSGMQFNDSYVLWQDDRLGKPRPLASEPVWNACVKHAIAELEGGIAFGEMLRIASESAECAAVNKALKAGSKLANLRGGPIIVFPPEDGPDLETEAPSGGVA